MYNNDGSYVDLVHSTSIHVISKIWQSDWLCQHSGSELFKISIFTEDTLHCMQCGFDTARGVLYIRSCDKKYCYSDYLYGGLPWSWVGHKGSYLGRPYHGQAVGCSGVKDWSTRGRSKVTNSLGAWPWLIQSCQEGKQNVQISHLSKQVNCINQRILN